MLRKTLTLVGAFTLMLVAARVDAAKHGWTIDLKAGTSIPRSDFERRVGAGLIGSVDLDYRAAKMLALGFDGFYVRNGGSDEYEARLTSLATAPVTASSTMLQGGGHVKLIFGEAAVSPFVLVGLGAYRLVDNWKSLDPQFDSQGGGETFLGTRAGLGVTCRTSERVSVVIEGTLHGAWTSFSWGSGYEARQIVSLQTGVSIGLGDPEP